MPQGTAKNAPPSGRGLVVRPELPVAIDQPIANPSQVAEDGATQLHLLRRLADIDGLEQQRDCPFCRRRRRPAPRGLCCVRTAPSLKPSCDLWQRDRTHCWPGIRDEWT